MPLWGTSQCPPSFDTWKYPAPMWQWQRAPPKDPLKNVASYKSAGWRKDLDHVLKAYYKHNYASFKEAEWTNLKDKFFKHLIQHQDGWKSIKENHPLQYMPYREKHFHAATGIKLKGLSDFMGWIKCSSYYHAVVARKGQLHKCPHLVGVELPRWLQVTPSESRQVSQRREGTPTTSPRMPSKEAMAAQGAQFRCTYSRGDRLSGGWLVLGRPG